MTQAVRNFIRKTCIIAGVCNIMLNSLFSWLGNRAMENMPPGSVAVDTAITTIIMSLLMTLFISADTRRALKAGLIEPSALPSDSGRLLLRLPARPWKLGIVIGLAIATVAVPSLVGFASFFGVESFSIFAYISLKVVYSLLLSYAVPRWVILRQLAAVA